MAKLEQARGAQPLLRPVGRACRSALNIACLVVAIGSCLLAVLPLVTWVLVDHPQPMPARLVGVQAGACLALLGLAVWSLRIAQRRR